MSREKSRKTEVEFHRHLLSMLDEIITSMDNLINLYGRNPSDKTASDLNMIREEIQKFVNSPDTSKENLEKLYTILNALSILLNRNFNL